jgi:hypothetical protein
MLVGNQSLDGGNCCNKKITNKKIKITKDKGNPWAMYFFVTKVLSKE